MNSPTVYTYGGLRIGDANFVVQVNSTVTIFRIVKQNDFIIRTPNCYYCFIDKVWKCYTSPLFGKDFYKTSFPIRPYYARYFRPLVSTGSTNVILIRKIVNPGSFIDKEAKLANKKAAKLENKQYRTTNNSNSIANFSIKINFAKKRNSQFAFKTSQIVPSLSNIRRLYSIWTYHKYIYYTQPVVTEIFYYGQMTTFKICRYNSGNSSCERKVQLPETFSSDAHKLYYGINFEYC